MIVYSKDRFKKSLRKTGGNFVGSISDFLSYMTPDVLKTDKEEKNSNSTENEESIKVHNYLDYNEKIMWKNTSNILLASLLALLISFILSFVSI